MSIYCVELTFSRGRLDGTILMEEDVKHVSEKILTVFADKFNGARAYSHQGSYKAQNGEIVLGSSTTVLSYTKTLDDVQPALDLLARQVATELEQECVLLTITELSGEMQWIFSDPLYGYVKNH